MCQKNNKCQFSQHYKINLKYSVINYCFRVFKMPTHSTFVLFVAQNVWFVMLNKFTFTNNFIKIIIMLLCIKRYKKVFIYNINGKIDYRIIKQIFQIFFYSFYYNFVYIDIIFYINAFVRPMNIFITNFETLFTIINRSFRSFTCTTYIDS